MLRVACMSLIFWRMDTASSLSTYPPAIGDSAIVAPSARPVSEAESPRPRRSRVKSLTFVNRSTRLGKRIAELKALFESAFSAGELTPIRRERIGEAAMVKAMAEEERGKWMRGEARCDLDELIRLERRAVAAVKALGIVEAKPKPSSPLAEHFSRPPVRSAMP
jgi:hypothetical protein